ncbi:hypothetical protein D3C84_1073750 [compost metagenome]
MLADQVNLNRIQGADGFSAFKGEHLEIIADRWDHQGELSGIGRCEHSLILLLC